MYERQQSGLYFWVRWFFLGPDHLVRPIWRALLFVVLGLVLITLLTGALGGFAGHLGSSRAAVFYVLVNGLLLLETWFLLSVLDRRSFRTVGLWFYGEWWRELLLGICFGAGLVGVVVGFQVLFGGVAFHGAAPKAAEALRGVPGAAGFLLLAAAFEEIAFRGYGFQRLVDSLGALGGVAAFSAVFGVGHMTNPGATPLSTANTILAGVLLAVAYLKTRALWMPIGLHWAWNFVMGSVLSLPVSGIRIGAPVFAVEVSEPEWLSGGSYGPEGSVVLTAVCTAAIVWLWRTREVHPSGEMDQALNPVPSTPQNEVE